jgi:hypothetical protein
VDRDPKLPCKIAAFSHEFPVPIESPMPKSSGLDFVQVGEPSDVSEEGDVS